MSRIYLVDDETMLLDSLEIILSLNDHEIVGKAHDGVEALAGLQSLPSDRQPELALVDLNMKGMGGIELIGEMKSKFPGIKILVLTTFYDDQNITAAISRGADGYLLKDSGKDAILGAVRQILGGTTVLDAKVMQRLTVLMSSQSSFAGTDGTGQSEIHVPESAVDPLTEREKEICSLIAEGLTNRQIADRLYISEGTVINYISSIYDKTGIHDRVKLTLALKE